MKSAPRLQEVPGGVRLLAPPGRALVEEARARADAAGPGTRLEAAGWPWRALRDWLVGPDARHAVRLVDVPRPTAVWLARAARRGRVGPPVELEWRGRVRPLGEVAEDVLRWGRAMDARCLRVLLGRRPPPPRPHGQSLDRPEHCLACGAWVGNLTHWVWWRRGRRACPEDDLRPAGYYRCQGAPPPAPAPRRRKPPARPRSRTQRRYDELLCSLRRAARRPRPLAELRRQRWEARRVAFLFNGPGAALPDPPRAADRPGGQMPLQPRRRYAAAAAPPSVQPAAPLRLAPSLTAGESPLLAAKPPTAAATPLSPPTAAATPLSLSAGEAPLTAARLNDVEQVRLFIAHAYRWNPRDPWDVHRMSGLARRLLGGADPPPPDSGGRAVARGAAAEAVASERDAGEGGLPGGRDELLAGWALGDLGDAAPDLSDSEERPDEPSSGDDGGDDDDGLEDGGELAAGGSHGDAFDPFGDSGEGDDFF